MGDRLPEEGEGTRHRHAASSVGQADHVLIGHELTAVPDNSRGAGNGLVYADQRGITATELWMNHSSAFLLYSASYMLDGTRVFAV